MRITSIVIGAAVFSLLGCADQEVAAPDLEPSFSNRPAKAGALVVNGWYEGEEIYYIDGGPEEGVTERGKNQIYIIGKPRLHQANVVLFIPGEPGYSPHWNVNVVNTAKGVTVQEILDYDSGALVSEHFDDEGVLFDDVEDILAAEAAGLVTIMKPGIVVLCPVTPEATADAPGNTEAPEIFEPFDLAGGF